MRLQFSRSVSTDRCTMYIFVVGVIVLVGLMQIPIIVDIFRAFSPGSKLRRTTHWCVKVLLVIAMSSLFIIGLSYFLVFFLPLTIEQPFSSFWGILHVAFAVWIWVNVVVNYYLAVFVHPGFIPKITSINHFDPELPTNGMQWNPVCFHYCTVCQENVAYMDHHCPFTGNCTGLKNYSYFLLFLIYGALGLGYAMWMSFSFFNQCVVNKIWWMLGYVELVEQPVCTQLGPHAYIFLAVMGGFYVTVNMSILQILLLLADISSYNLLKNLTKIPVLSFAWQRITGGKYKDPKSRMNLMLLRQRPSLLWFLIPYMNTNDDIAFSVIKQE